MAALPAQESQKRFATSCTIHLHVLNAASPNTLFPRALYARTPGERAGDKAQALVDHGTPSAAFAPPARKRKGLPMAPIRNVIYVSIRPPGECHARDHARRSRQDHQR